MIDKKLKANDLKSNIVDLLSTGKIREKTINSTHFRCEVCAMSGQCLVHISLPCMSFNRQDKTSVYYYKTTTKTKQHD